MILFAVVVKGPHICHLQRFQINGSKKVRIELLKLLPSFAALWLVWASRMQSCCAPDFIQNVRANLTSALIANTLWLNHKNPVSTSDPSSTTITSQVLAHSQPTDRYHSQEHLLTPCQLLPLPVTCQAFPASTWISSFLTPQDR